MNDFIDVEPEGDEELNKYLIDRTEPDDDVMLKFFITLGILGIGAFSTVISAYDRLS